MNLIIDQTIKLVVFGVVWFAVIGFCYVVVTVVTDIKNKGEI